MTLGYFSRLLCVALASFFLIYVAASVPVAAFASAAIRFAGRLSPRPAARFLLILRLLPAGLAVSAALGLCVPSYLWFEPEPFDEPVGRGCLIAAVLGLALCALAMARALGAAIRSRRFSRECLDARCQARLREEHPPAFVVGGSAPFLALTGIVRPRVVLSEGIAAALSEEELAVVLRHERAHARSRDNLKRLCIFLAPGIVPGRGPWRRLERAWASFAEYAADQEAVSGDAPRAVALASALVRVARFGSASATAPLAISFLGSAAELEGRVERLLSGPPLAAALHRVSKRAAFSAAIASACLMAALLRPTTLRFVQSVLERAVVQLR